MRLIIYDCECFLHDWLVVFKDHESGAYTVVHNDAEALRECISDENIYIGFNSKFYDQYIIKAICCGFTPEEVKAVNDFIIGGGQGWEYPPLQDCFFRFNNADIRDDVQQGLSLKAIEGHLGMDIRESTIPFDIDRPLTQDERKETEYYCKHDVDTTEMIVELRKGYLTTKFNLGNRAGLEAVKSLALTNAKLTAMMLQAKRQEWNDGRDYVYPENLDINVIPKDILNFFETIHNTSIPDDELFNTSFETTLGGMPVKYAWGGVHGSLKGYYERSSESRVIENRDVSSLYPTLIEKYNYLSRNVPDPELFYSIRRERIQAKHSGDKQTANDLKLPLNTVSGAQENKYNDLYDPLPTRSLRISGQLFLTVLVMRLLNACKTIKFLNLNTDGLMYSIDRDELPIVDMIAHNWEEETQFELEKDEIDHVWIKDVNNLLFVKKDKSVKKAGGYLNFGISNKGAWNINTNLIVVKQAVIEYLLNGTAPEDTINNCNKPLRFQMIAKASHKYKEVYHIVDGNKTPVQRVNRVYATSDDRYGTLYKIKDDGTQAKIENLPEHCITDNENILTLNDIDKQWYVNRAKKMINEFLGITPEDKPDKKKSTTERSKKTMSTTNEKKETSETVKDKTMDVYDKLAEIRREFPTMGIEKSGKNTHAEFLYFELSDIVPVVNKLFQKYHCMFLVSFTNNTAVGTFRDLDEHDPEKNEIVFLFPMKSISEPAKFRMNEVQALGAELTYMRRYLYYLLLDISNADEFDSQSETAPAPVNKAFATPAQRETVKQTLTNPEGKATDLQIRQLKNVLKNLMETKPEKEEMIAELAVKTKGFTEISKAECENIIASVSALLESDDNNLSF